MVYVLLGNGFEDMEATAPVDILRRGGVSVAYVGVSDMTARGMMGVTVTADIPLDGLLLSEAELLVLPGGDTMRAGNYGSSQEARDLIVRAAAAGVPVAAICAAPVVLAELGLLKGKRCTCYPSCAGQLDGGVRDDDARVVRDGGIITGQGPGSAVEFGLNLLAFLRGEAEAEAVRRQIYFGGITYAV